MAPLNGQLRGTRKQASQSSASRQTGQGSGSGSNSHNVVPCGACKFLRRRCEIGCIFAPHFGTEQGGALFAAIHKVFGASNLSKLLVQLPPHHRHHAVQTVLYEAQARLHDPVGGCVTVIFGLIHQVVSLQMELARVQNELITEGLQAANALQQQPEPVNNLAVQPGHHFDFQPMLSTGSFAPNNNTVNMNMFDPNLNNLANGHQNADFTEPSVDPPLYTGPFFNDEGDDVDPFVFADQMFYSG